MAVKTFTTEVLTSADTNTYLANSGLVYVTTTSLSGSSTTISNCFSSIYDNYLIVINNLVTGANSLNVLQFATGSTDSSSNYGRVRLYAQATVGSSTSITNSSSGWGYSTSSGASFYKIEVSQPNLARQTFTMSQGNYQDSLYPYIEQQNGLLNTTTQYTGIVFTPIGSTYTSGTATVFGYRKA